MSLTANSIGQQNIQVIVVLGSWSSGSTAITGYISRAGAYSCPPHQMTNDVRTPDSHEPKVLRDSLAECVDEMTLRMRLHDKIVFRDWFLGWIEDEKSKAVEAGFTHIILKHPLASFFIREIQEACQPNWLVITRPLEDIEATRQRRGWHPVYGKAGASIIYNHIFSEIMNFGNTAFCVNFQVFCKNYKTRAKILEQLELAPTSERLSEAENWIVQ